ncbi:MAG: AAA family ATPase, partial [Proteobacteria bacterium]|nr:AAA family ATPase [Pseudomonadota bacterium]
MTTTLPMCTLIYEPGDDTGDGLVTNGKLVIGKPRLEAPLSEPPRFKPTPIKSGVHREMIEVVLRQMVKRKWAKSIVTSDGVCRDLDVLALFGLEDAHPATPMTAAQLDRALVLQLQRLQRARKPRQSVLARNIGTMGDLIGLNRDEQALLRIATLFTPEAELFRDFFRLVARRPSERLTFIADAAGVTQARAQRLLAEGRMLRLCGLFENINLDEILERALPCMVTTRWVTLLTAPRLSAERLLRHLLRRPPKATLNLSDFAHVAQTEVVVAYLRQALERNQRGVNVLIHGAPGTGKTQFVRSCAAALGTTLYEVPNEDDDGDPVSGARRFGAFAVCQRILSQRRGQLLLFDEVEDVFGGDADCDIPGLRLIRTRRNPESLRKSWINETLETNPVPAFWACNQIGGLDPAFVRRFDLVVEFRMPGRAVRRRMIDRYFRRGDISEACAERLSAIPVLAPAQVERAARVTRALGAGNVAQRDAQVEGIVQSSLLAMGHPRVRPAVALPGHYDPAFLNADRDLSALAQALRTRPAARLCLYGAPGTGKTAYAHHLGRVLDQPVLVRRASDLLDMYVGGTEANISAAFEQARDDGAILVIDEADGFLRDRAGAQRNFEVTQVNELLTQMEAFDGLFVASTNLVDTLDAAALRRFDFKVRFDCLRRDQRSALLARICGIADGDLPAATLATLDRLNHLTPGDFANVLRQ